MSRSVAISVAPQVCVLLCGGLKPTSLEKSLGCGTLDLFLTPRTTVLDAWCDRFAALKGDDGTEMRVVITIGRGSLGTNGPEKGAGAVSIFRDENDYRGPAGAVKDAAGEVDNNRDLVICEAGLWGAFDLEPVVAAHEASGAAVTVCRNPDMSPAGVYIAKGWTLGLIPHKGFMDLKEQWLTKLQTSEALVRVHDCPSPGAVQLRERSGYIECCRVLAMLGNGEPEITHSDLFIDAQEAAGHWTLEIDGAEVSGRALVVDSVVMPGAVIEEDAVVVRSVVGPGQRVKRGQQVLDAVVGDGGVVYD